MKISDFEQPNRDGITMAPIEQCTSMIVTFVHSIARHIALFWSLDFHFLEVVCGTVGGGGQVTFSRPKFWSEPPLVLLDHPSRRYPKGR
jgi:hypothetical protein